MPKVMKRVRLINPAKRKANPKKRLSPLQKLFFGSKRQRSAVAKTLGRRKSNPSWKAHKKAAKAMGTYKRDSELTKYNRTALAFKKHLGFTSTTRRKKRKPNVGQILAITPLINPSRQGRGRFSTTPEGSIYTSRQKSALKRGNKSQIRWLLESSIERGRKYTARKKTNPKGRKDSPQLSAINRKVRKAYKQNKGNSTEKSIQYTLRSISRYLDRKRKANPKSVTMAKRKTGRKRVGVNQYGMPALGYRKKLRYAGKAKKGQYKYILNPRKRKATRRKKTYARKANPTVVIMRGRQRNPSTRRHRNPGFLPKGGMILKVGGFFGGIFITNMVKNILPMQLRSGVLGILGTGLSAWVASKAIRMATGNAALANSVFFGGQTVTVVTALKEFAPGIASQLPGLGLVVPSNSLYPQIPSAGAIGPPYTQSVIAGMLPAPAMRGLPAPNITTRLMRQR